MWEFLDKSSLAQTEIRLPVNNDNDKPPIRFGANATGFYCISANVLAVTLNGDTRWIFSGNNLTCNVSTGPSLANVIASDTVPTIIPDRSDDNTGIGQKTADELSLIAGGAEAARVDKTLVANSTRFMLWDVTAGGMQRVTIGVAGSGGVGYRLLRIAN